MSTTYQCGDNTALVGYLYGECEPDERAAIGAHLAICAACAAELAALESTRIHLASWSPPESGLGFVMTRPKAQDPTPQGGLESEASKSSGAWGLGPGTWFARPLPAWVQLAAAAGIFAAGLSLGIMRGAMREAPVTPAASASEVESISAATLDALERRLRGEIARLRTSEPAPAAAPASPVEGRLLAQVRALIDESEQRQQRELALRTAQIVRDFDSQRRVDLEQIQHNFGQIEGLTGAEAREQRQMLNYLMRVSQQQ